MAKESKEKKLKNEIELVTLYSTDKNKHHKKGAKIVTNKRIAKVLIDKGYASEAAGKAAKG